MNGSTGGPVVRNARIINERGLHARAAARFVQLAQKFDSRVEVGFSGQSVGATSIMGLMMLGAAKGALLEIRATGRDAAHAADALAKLVARGFEDE
ncbi:MAG TPA: HPr family phosphocarrier protein [Alphaproteobacteria bacterium]|jgi:phosphocarrier protein